MPQYFVCPGDKGTTEFKLSEVPDVREGFTLKDAWDFGPAGPLHCSYAYRMPFVAFALKSTDDPTLPVAADRNPWIGSPGRVPKSLPSFRPDSTSLRRHA